MRPQRMHSVTTDLAERRVLALCDAGLVCALIAARGEFYRGAGERKFRHVRSWRK